MPINFKQYMCFREGKETLSQPHEIKADPPMKLPNGIKRLAEVFKRSKEVAIGKEIDTKAGGEKDVTLKTKRLFIVGGAVRDYLLGHTPSKYELATDAHPEEVTKILNAAKPAIKITKQDVKKGITSVSIDGENYDIRTMKKKSGNPDEGEIFTTNPAEEDHDFTINSMYYDITGNKIIDYNGGIQHIRDGTIRFHGNAEDKLKGDGLSKFKMIRYMLTVPNGKIDDETKGILGELDEDENTPPEKIREEFLKGLEHAHVDVKKYIKAYEDYGLLDRVFPGLEINADLPECGTCKNRAIILAYLLKDNKPSKLVSKLKELKYTDREIKDAVYLINLNWFAPDHIYDFKKELLHTSLTKRQIMDWAKMNNLDKKMIEKLLEYQPRVKEQEMFDKENFVDYDPEVFKSKIKKMEAEEFKKTLNA